MRMIADPDKNKKRKSGVVPKDLRTNVDGQG